MRPEFGAGRSSQCCHCLCPAPDRLPYLVGEPRTQALLPTSHLLGRRRTTTTPTPTITSTWHEVSTPPSPLHPPSHLPNPNPSQKIRTQPRPPRPPLPSRLPRPPLVRHPLGRHPHHAPPPDLLPARLDRRHPGRPPRLPVDLLPGLRARQRRLRPRPPRLAARGCVGDGCVGCAAAVDWELWWGDDEL